MANTNDRDGLADNHEHIVAAARSMASKNQLYLMNRLNLMNQMNRLNRMNHVMKTSKRCPVLVPPPHRLSKPMPKLCTMQNPSVTERGRRLFPQRMPISFTMQVPTEREVHSMPKRRPRPTSVADVDADRGNGGTGDSKGGGSDVDDTIITNPMLMMLPTKRAPEQEHSLDKYRCLGFEAFREIVKSDMEDRIKRLIQDRKHRGINT